MGLSGKNSRPSRMALNAGSSIWNCRTVLAPGMPRPPRKYRARSSSQVRLKVRPRKAPTWRQLEPRFVTTLFVIF